MIFMGCLKKLNGKAVYEIQNRILQVVRETFILTITLTETIWDELSSSIFKKSDQHVTNYVFKRIKIIFTPTRMWLFIMSLTILRYNRMVPTSWYSMYMYKKNNEPNIIAIFVTVISFVTCNNDWTCTSYCYIRML